MNLHATQAEAAPPPRNAALKFTYPSGSRPLDGYTIKRGIGRGGFGEVYYASSDAGKEVALKLIRRNLDVELRGVTQCLNLKHPNLLGLFDIKQDDLGDSWVVMEYVAGECLEEAISRHAAGIPRDEALSWFHGVAAGVTYLHDRGIVHRDLKPGNIFCDEGLVKIGDYGLSKFISASRRSGQTESVGTVHYMAPEIGNGRYGKEIDIYALGIILYEMLTGRVPFDGESVGEVLMKHLTAEPDLSGLEPPFQAAIARTLTKNPDGRIQSVSELLAMLPAAPAGASAAPSAFAGARGPAPRVPPVASPPEEQQPQSRRPAGRPAAEVVSSVELVEEEPIWRAVRQGWAGFTRAWKSGQINTSSKIAIVVLAIVVLFNLNLALIPLAMTTAFFYAVYFGLRSIVLAKGGHARRFPHYAGNQHEVHRPAGQAAAPAEPQAAAGPPPAPIAPPSAQQAPLRHASTNPYVRTYPRRFAAAPPKPARQRVQELLGSLLLSAGVAAAMCVIMVILRGAAPSPEQFAWLTLVSTAGAWAVLVPAKLWEGASGDAALRRFLLMVLGLGLGAVAWGASDLLMVQLDYGWGTPRSMNAPIINFPNFYDELHGHPSLMGHMAYFAFLLVALRWWRQADPGRPVRLSLGATFIAALWSWLLFFFWPFPQPWGVMVATTMSVAVQLASPWQPSERHFTDITE
jgi:hypothetical protein